MAMQLGRPLLYLMVVAGGRADLGFAYIFQDHEEQEPGYKFKVGASLLDVGRLEV